MSDKEQIRQEKREVRRKRRIRNQIAAYAVLIILLLAAAAGIVYGVNALMEKAKNGEKDVQQGSDENDISDSGGEKQDMIEDLLGQEEAIPTPEPVPEPTPEVVELTREEKLDEIVNAGIEVMPLEDKVAGLFIVTPEAITGVGTVVQAGEGTKDALNQNAVGGLIYFKKNIQSEEQLKEMLENTAIYTRYPLFLAVDEEGGSVARLGSSGIGPQVEGAGDIGASGDENRAYEAGLAIGGTLADVGFNLDFAPVADLANVDGSAMEGRSYGSDAAAVSGFVTSMMTGLEEKNVTACLKHFPGIGSTSADTHNGMATTERTLEQFQQEEFAVFQAGIDAGANMIMVGHMSAPALTGNNEPCIFSEQLITGILREQMGFKGVIITDSLSMAAISDYYGSGEAAVYAILAGCDMLLMPENYEEAYNEVLEAVRNGQISEERIDDCLRRIYRIKYADRIEE